MKGISSEYDFVTSLPRFTPDKYMNILSLVYPVGYTTPGVALLDQFNMAVVPPIPVHHDSKTYL